MTSLGPNTKLPGGCARVGDGAAASTGGSLFTLEPPESVDHRGRWQVLPYSTHILVIIQAARPAWRAAAVVRGNGGASPE